MRLKENFKRQCMKQIWNFHRGGEGRGEVYISSMGEGININFFSGSTQYLYVDVIMTISFCLQVCLEDWSIRQEINSRSHEEMMLK